MLFFVQNETSVVTILLASEGDEVSGVTEADVQCFISKNGATPTEYDLTGKFTEIDSTTMPGLYRIELEGTSVFDTEGEIILRFFEDGTPISPFDPYLIRGNVYTTDVSGLDTTTLSIKSTVEDNQTALGATNTNVTAILTDLGIIKGGASFNSSTDSLHAQRAAFDARVPSEVAKLSDLQNAGLTQVAPPGVGLWDALGDGSISLVEVGDRVRRILGLVHENFVITGQTYDSNNNLLGASVKIYETDTDAAADINAIATYVIEATYDGDGRLVDYKMLRDN